MPSNNEIEVRYTDPEADLNNLFAEMTEGFKVSIRRIEPEWCKGNVGTFEFDPSEPISVEWIEKRFGGTKYHVQVKTPDNQFTGSRTIMIPETPKKNGMELMPGPHGAPILAAQGVVKQQPAQENKETITVLEKMLQLQHQQNEALQKMLLDRVAKLETLLTTRIETPAPQAQPVQTQQVPFYDPSVQLKSTLETFKMMEELRSSLRGAEQETEPENPLLTKMMDKMIERLTEEKPAAASQGSPPLPPRTEPSNIELANLVKSRLRTMSQDEKDFILNDVFEEEETEDFDNGQDEVDRVDLLSGEDQAELEEARQNGGDLPQDDSPAH